MNGFDRQWYAGRISKLIKLTAAETIRCRHRIETDNGRRSPANP
jgi:hypothetical protein